MAGLAGLASRDATRSPASSIGGGYGLDAEVYSPPSAAGSPGGGGFGLDSEVRASSPPEGGGYGLSSEVSGDANDASAAAPASPPRAAGTHGEGLGALASGGPTLASSPPLSPRGGAGANANANANDAASPSYRGVSSPSNFRKEATDALAEKQSKQRLAAVFGSPNGEADALEPTNARQLELTRVEEANAATKIQAVFRGGKTREEIALAKRFGASSDPGQTDTVKRSLILSGDAQDRTEAASAAAAKSGYGLGADDWERFAARQLSRFVAPAPGGLTASDETRGYRLRVLAVEAYPFGAEAYRVAGRSNKVEVRAAVSFYDEASGTFHGATCSSVPEEVTLPPPEAANGAGRPQPAKGKNARDNAGKPKLPVATLDVQHDVYFTTKIRDARCLLVLEIVLVERRGGTIVRETSGGWAAIPTVDKNGREPVGEPSSAPIRAGSPRYLMWGRPRAGQHPPAQLGDARVHFIYEPAPMLSHAKALIPDDFPVTYGDVIPGMLRFDPFGQLTSNALAITSTLAAPVLAPTRRVALRGLKVRLPKALSDVVAASPATARAIHGPDAQPPSMESLAANPTAAAAAVAASKCVFMRASVHNGRRFVGASVDVDAWAADVDGVSTIRLTKDAVVPNVPEDVLVVLILEVMYRAPGTNDAPYVLGWTAVSPFKPGADFGDAVTADAPGGLELRVGGREATLRTTRGPRSEPAVDWRSVVQAPHEVWRGVVRYRGVAAAEDNAIAMSFEAIAAHGDAGDPGTPGRAKVSKIAGGGGSRAGAGAVRPDLREQIMASPRGDQQLAALAAAMQAQINQLAHTVHELRNSPVRTVAALPAAPAAPAPAPAAGDFSLNAHTISTEAEEEWPGGGDPNGPASAPKDAARNLFSGGVAAANPPKGLGGFTRATRARLHAAGADATLPPDVRLALRAGAAAESARRTGAPPPPPDMLKEHKDIKAVNEVIIQFLAYRKLDAINAANDGLADVHFTFNFFDFPGSTSRACRLTPSDAKPGEPQLLVPEGAARDTRSTSAGASAKAGEAWFKFVVDGDGNGAGDRRCDAHDAMHARRVDFVEYLARDQLHVDVWDGSSLMQHGVASVDLAGLLRQGRESAEVLVEAHVMDHRERESGEAAKGRRRRAALSAARGESADADADGGGVSGGAVARGALLVRLINVGKKPEARLLPPPGWSPALAASRDAERDAKTVRVRAVPESGGELAATLRGAAENVPPGGAKGLQSLTERRKIGDRSVLQEQEARKLSREARLKEIRSGGGGVGGLQTLSGARVGGGGLQTLSGASSSSNRLAPPDADEHAVQQKLLEDIESARRRAKRASVLEKLRSGLAAKKTVRPAYGELCFFEHEFKSPVNVDCVFEVRCDDPEVMLVASAAEWRGLREAAGMAPTAAGMEDDALAGNRLFLLAGESVKVPFKFQSFAAWDDGGAGGGDEGLHLRPRTVAVHFVNTEDGASAAVLHVHVKPKAMTVQKTFRFHAPEHDFFKARLLPPGGVPTRDARGNCCLAVRASDPAVAAAVTTATSSESAAAAGARRGSEEIALRYKCGGCAPGPDAAGHTSDGGGTVSFYVCVYADVYLGRLAATWRVYVHPTQRADVSSLVGQTSHSSVVVPGGKTMRRVAAFSSHPDEVQVTPDRLTLPANALTEVNIAFRPLVAGRLDVVVHLVDLDRRELVHSRLVSTDARGPTINKTFDVDLSPGVRCHKKITYTNPYPKPKAFYLRCTHPLLLHFRPEKLELPANGSRPMGLTFEPAEAWASLAGRRAPSEGGEPVEVLVFINDEEDATEECFRIRVNADAAYVGAAR